MERVPGKKQIIEQPSDWDDFEPTPDMIDEGRQSAIDEMRKDRRKLKTVV